MIPPDGGLNKESFFNVLGAVSECLSESRTEQLADLITYDFLHSITNAEFQLLAQPYTGKWASENGDRFPESFLLHCLAGGDVAVFTNQYDSLTNLVSRNCIRWCLMV
ncbi:MAG TPA: hypothetical protein VLL07_03230, partial [Pontiella sp.]|nr:hypothetical protein [Pontiella sp.]